MSFSIKTFNDCGLFKYAKIHTYNSSQLQTIPLERLNLNQLLNSVSGQTGSKIVISSTVKTNSIEMGPAVSRFIMRKESGNLIVDGPNEIKNDLSR